MRCLCCSNVTGILLETDAPKIGVDIKEAYDTGIVTLETSMPPFPMLSNDVSNEIGRSEGLNPFLIFDVYLLSTSPNGRRRHECDEIPMKPCF